MNLSFAGALDYPQDVGPGQNQPMGETENIYQQTTSNVTGMPLFTQEQMTYHRYVTQREEYKSQNQDDPKHALAFLDFVNAHKKSELHVEFEIGSPYDNRYAFQNFNAQPILLFIFEAKIDATTQTWIDQILCNPVTAELINKSFKTFGVLSNSQFLLGVLKFLDGKELPTMMILRKDQWDEILLVGGDRCYTDHAIFIKKPLVLNMILIKSMSVFRDDSVVDRDFVERYKKRRRDRENFENLKNNPGGVTISGKDMSDQQFDKVLVDREEKERQDLIYQQSVIQDQLDENSRLESHQMKEEELINETAANEQKFDKKVKLGQMFAGLEEPVIGEGVIECNFRCVSGERIKRNFLFSERMQVRIF